MKNYDKIKHFLLSNLEWWGFVLLMASVAVMNTSEVDDICKVHYQKGFFLIGASLVVLGLRRNHGKSS